MNDPDMKWFAVPPRRQKVSSSCRNSRRAFIFGVEGGSGVVLARDEKTGTWSEPVFSKTSSSQFRPQAEPSPQRRSC